MKEFICGLCKKKYYSRESLLEHMDGHSEEEWRGMKPGIEAKIDANSLNGSISEEEELSDAVNMLLSLGNGDHLAGKVDEDEVMTSYSSTHAEFDEINLILELKNKKSDFCEREHLDSENLGRIGENGKGKGILKPGFGPRKSGSFNRSNKADHQTVAKNKKISVEKMPENVCFLGPESTNKSFPTHGALRGHWSSPNKNICNTIDEQSSNATNQFEENKVPRGHKVLGKAPGYPSSLNK